MRELIRPMLATAGKLPTHDTGYGVEFKWDGVRAITYTVRGSAGLFSRNDRDITNAYPELVALADLAGDRRIVLDGEIVALDPAGRPSFGVLQNRMLLCTTQVGTQGGSARGRMRRTHMPS